MFDSTAVVSVRMTCVLTAPCATPYWPSSPFTFFQVSGRTARKHLSRKRGRAIRVSESSGAPPGLSGRYSRTRPWAFGAGTAACSWPGCPLRVYHRHAPPVPGGTAGQPAPEPRGTRQIVPCPTGGRTDLPRRRFGDGPDGSDDR